MSINGALKNLIKKLGGSSTKNTTEGLINDIAANISGGGDDDTSGDDVMYAIAVVDPETDSTMLNVSYNDIATAVFEDNKAVLFVQNYGNKNRIGYLVDTYIEQDDSSNLYKAVFASENGEVEFTAINATDDLIGDDEGVGNFGGVMFINVTYDFGSSIDDTTWNLANVVFDKTYAEVKKAYDAGILPVAINDKLLMYLYGFVPENAPAEPCFRFARIDVGLSGIASDVHLLVTRTEVKLNKTSSNSGQVMSKQV